MATATKPKSVKSATTAKPAPSLKSAQRTANILKQLGDATRVRVILMLDAGERNVGAICGELKQSQPAVSHHLALLRHGGIVEARRDGKASVYGLTETGRMLAGVVGGVMGGKG